MLNKVTLIGNLGSDPEIRMTKAGKEIANFSLATTQHWKDKSTGDRMAKTEWHKVSVLSEGLAKIVKAYTKKGSRVYVEGELETSSWEDKNGVKKYTTQVLVKGFGGEIKLLDTKDKVTDNPERQPEMIDDEIPF